jgi:hypothetical protein
MTRAKCDCCLQPYDRLWFYPHRHFEMLFAGELQDYLAGWWAFCVYCRALKEQRDFHSLAARVISLAMPAEFRAEAAQATGVFELLYRALVDDAICGDGVLWKEGQDRGPRRFPCPPPGAVDPE